MRDTNILHLHPSYRERSDALMAYVIERKLPLDRYEGWRDPNRQAYLFSMGRAPGVGTPGKHPTFERAWEGNHQYGFAEDWVWLVKGRWQWDAPDGHHWDEFAEAAARAHLQRLKFEQPHVQFPGFSGKEILAGRAPWPTGGDDSWEQNIEAAIIAWGPLSKTVNGIVQPGAPRLVTERPPIAGRG